MPKQTNYNVGIYVRLSKDDERLGESVSIENQVIICKGGILPPNTYYDCGSFVVNRKAVIGKEKQPNITAENYYTASLKIGINYSRANKLHSALFQVF